MTRRRSFSDSGSGLQVLNSFSRRTAENTVSKYMPRPQVPRYEVRNWSPKAASARSGGSTEKVLRNTSVGSHSSQRALISWRWVITKSFTERRQGLTVDDDST